MVLSENKSNNVAKVPQNWLIILKNSTLPISAALSKVAPLGPTDNVH